MTQDEFNRLLRKYQMEHMASSFNDNDPSKSEMRDTMDKEVSYLDKNEDHDAPKILDEIENRVKQENLLPKKYEIDPLSGLEKEQKQYIQPSQQNGMADSIERIRKKLLGHS